MDEIEALLDALWAAAVVGDTEAAFPEHVRCRGQYASRQAGEHFAST